MGTYNEFTFAIAQSGYATGEYSSLEISPQIDGSPLAGILERALDPLAAEICGGYAPQLEGFLPYFDIADYSKQERSYRKTLFFCEDRDCGCNCDISACIRRKGDAMVMEQFVHHCYADDARQGADSALGISPFVFDKAAFDAELDRARHALASSEQADQLALPTALMRVYHNGCAARFFVRSTNRSAWVYPNNDMSKAYEALADQSLHVIIPLEDKKPGDKVLVCFDNIEWEHDSSDEQALFYSGHNGGYYYGICVPDDETAEDYKGKPESSFLVETMMLEEYPDLYVFRDIQFEVTKCKKRDKRDFIVLTIAWCSEEKKHARQIATGATW